MVFIERGWTASMADRMVHLLVRQKGAKERLTRNRFSWIQEGFGLLAAEAGIAMRDWVRTQ